MTKDRKEESEIRHKTHRATLRVTLAPLAASPSQTTIGYHSRGVSSISANLIIGCEGLQLTSAPALAFGEQLTYPGTSLDKLRRKQ